MPHSSWHTRGVSKVYAHPRAITTAEENRRQSSILFCAANSYGRTCSSRATDTTRRRMAPTEWEVMITCGVVYGSWSAPTCAVSRLKNYFC